MPLNWRCMVMNQKFSALHTSSWNSLLAIEHRQGRLCLIMLPVYLLASRYAVHLQQHCMGHFMAYCSQAVYPSVVWQSKLHCLESIIVIVCSSYIIDLPPACYPNPAPVRMGKVVIFPGCGAACDLLLWYIGYHIEGMLLPCGLHPHPFTVSPPVPWCNLRKIGIVSRLDCKVASW